MSTNRLVLLSGVSNVTELDNTSFLNPKIDINGDLFIGKLYGEQTLFMIKSRSMDNSDGAEWLYPGQTKTCAYYLVVEENEESFNWGYLGDIE